MTKTNRSSGRLVEVTEDHAMEDEASIDKKEAPPEAPRFKKMKPRVGNQYQTKVPKSVASAPYEPNRPLPDKLSAEYPDVRLKDIKMIDMDPVSKDDDNGFIHALSTGDNSTVTSFPVLFHSNIENSRRTGGTCVHRASLSSLSSSSNNVSSFVHTAQHLLLPLPSEEPVLSNEAFAQEMISRYGSTTNTRRKKRRLASANEEWSSCAALTARHNKDVHIASFPEDAAVILEHLYTRHDGYVERAEIGLRVHLSHGTARKARRILLQDWHSNRFKRPSAQSSASWRQRLERDTSLWGDLRSDPTEVMYPFKNDADNSTTISRKATKALPHATDDDMKGVWRSILAYAQSMERAVATVEAGGQRPKFSELVNFIRSAYALPLPEECFGNRHVCVEQISECFQNLLDHVSKARDALAEISDFLAKDEDGVDMVALRKLLDEELTKESALVLDEEAVLRVLLLAASEWQKRVDALSESQEFESERDNLVIGEELAEEARSLAIRTAGLVALEKRIERARQLEARLQEFSRGGKTNTVKLVSALVKESNRVNLPSIQVRKLCKFHKELELWVDRANIAIRSRISMAEIESLIDRAKAMPLSLNEYLDKLNSRVRLARTWVAQLEAEVPCSHLSGDDAKVSTTDQIEWLKCMRRALGDDKMKGGKCSRLLDLCSEGVRIPVEITSMKMLQSEIDAKNWSLKAEKWIPRGTDTKKGKVEDLRDHLRKAEILRERLPIDAKENWSLENEPELRSIVESADKWFEEFEPYLDWDNRRSAVRKCLSFEKLRRIVTEGTAIHAQIGNSVTKMARVLAQAEAWFEKNKSLLIRAGIMKVDGDICVGLATLSELSNAAAAASTDVSLDLEEAVALKEIITKIQSWVDRTGNAAPIKRSKRVGKGRWSRKPTRFRIDDLVDLISEAKMLPIPTDDEVHRLTVQLNDVHAWRLRAHDDIKEIANGFHSLRATIQTVHGAPEDFYNAESIRRQTNLHKPEVAPDCSAATAAMEIDDATKKGIVVESQDVSLPRDTSAIPLDLQKQNDENLCQSKEVLIVAGDSKESLNPSQSLESTRPLECSSSHYAEEDSKARVDISRVTTEPQDNVQAEVDSQEVAKIGSDSDEGSDARHIGEESTLETSSQSSVGELDLDLAGQSKVEQSIAAMLTEARLIGVVTGEEDVVLSLESVSKWCGKSLKALEKPCDLYEKRTYNQLDGLIQAGQSLLETASTSEDKGIDRELANMLRTSWSSVVKDQLRRLEKLRSHRDKFAEWSKLAQALMSAREKKITFEALDDLAEQSQEYPASADIVQRVRTLHHRMSKWKETATTQLYSPQRKMLMQEAKGLCDEGEKLKMSCHELKILRNAIRTTRGWLNRVKKCKVAEGGTTASEVERLIDEHSELIIAMPEEVEKLKQVMKGYCLCRRPYEGFMIGCDGCDEWYHGPCIGVSESQADRYEKYLCVRCCMKRVFKNSSTAIISTIRKWTSEKDRKRARQADYQKHQRKVRKEKKDMEKCEAKILNLRQQIGVSSQKLPNSEDFKPAENTERLGDVQMQSIICETLEKLIHPDNSIVPGCVSTSEVVTEDPNQSPVPMVVEAKDEPKNETKPMLVEPAEANVKQAPEELEGEVTSSDTERDKGSSKISKEDAGREINELLHSVGECKDRLAALGVKATERTALDKEEDHCSNQLKVWCVRVRSLVLVPTKDEIANQSRPLVDGSLSPSMLELFQDAEMLGIAKFPDVHLVANAFQCISWSSLAMATLAKRATLGEIQHVLNCCASINLPCEKGVRILKSMVQRTTQWQMKARKGLAPKSGETRPFSMELLRTLEFGCSAIPFEVPEISCLANAIEDKGRRYCLCGGANDGSFMLGCDKCENWFHGRCVGVDKETGNKLESWHCPSCKGEGVSDGSVSRSTLDFADLEDDDSSPPREDSPSAPTIEKLWPPFGLLGSTMSLEALGESCMLIADTVGDLNQSTTRTAEITLQTDNHNVVTDIQDQTSEDFMTASGRDELPSADLAVSVKQKKCSLTNHMTRISMDIDETVLTASKESPIANSTPVSNAAVLCNEYYDRKKKQFAELPALTVVANAVEVPCRVPIAHMVLPELDESVQDESGAHIPTSCNSEEVIARIDCNGEPKQFKRSEPQSASISVGSELRDALVCNNASQPIENMDCDAVSQQQCAVGEIIPAVREENDEETVIDTTAGDETIVREQRDLETLSECIVSAGNNPPEESTTPIDQDVPAQPNESSIVTNTSVGSWDREGNDAAVERAAAGKAASLGIEPITLAS